MAEMFWTVADVTSQEMKSNCSSEELNALWLQSKKKGTEDEMTRDVFYRRRNRINICKMFGSAVLGYVSFLAN